MRIDWVSTDRIVKGSGGVVGELESRRKETKENDMTVLTLTEQRRKSWRLSYWGLHGYVGLPPGSNNALVWGLSYRDVSST